jgi:hypothetical protein
MNAVMDFCQGPIELQNMPQGEPAKKIRGGQTRFDRPENPASSLRIDF